MYLKDIKNGDLVEVLDITALIDPSQSSFQGRYHAGEEIQDSADFNKQDVIFPSGEALPGCWLDPRYRS